VEGTKSLTEEDKKQLLLNAFGDNEYQRLLSRLSLVKPRD